MVTKLMTKLMTKMMREGLNERKAFEECLQIQTQTCGLSQTWSQLLLISHCICICICICISHEVIHNMILLDSDMDTSIPPHHNDHHPLSKLCPKASALKGFQTVQELANLSKAKGWC